jgi:hypothetical protein
MFDDIIKCAEALPATDPKRAPLRVVDPTVADLLGWKGYADRCLGPDFRHYETVFGTLALAPDDHWNEWQFGDDNGAGGVFISNDRTDIEWTEIERYGADPTLGLRWSTGHDAEEEQTDPDCAGEVLTFGLQEMLDEFERPDAPQWAPLIRSLRTVIDRQGSGIARGLILTCDEATAGLFAAVRRTCMDFPDGGKYHARIGYLVTPAVLTLPETRSDLVEAAAAAAMFRMVHQDVAALLRRMPEDSVLELHLGAVAAPATVAALEPAFRACAEALRDDGFDPLHVDFADPVMIPR